MIKVLHLSDLHIVKDSDWNNLKALLLDTARCEFKNLPIGQKFLILTGDFHIFHESDYVNSTEFIRGITEEMGIDLKEDVFVIPGNHDLSLSDDPKKCKYQKAFVKAVKNDLSELQDDNSLEMLLSSFAKYNAFCVKLGLYDDTDIPARVHVRTWRNKLNILHINTCLTADGGDKNNQLADSKAITDIVIEHNYPGIAIGHNSFFDLHESIQTAITAPFARADIRAYLCGDQHKILRERNQQMIRLREGYGDRDSIPNIVCCRSSADVNDDYSDVGCIIHKWDENSGHVDIEYLIWQSKIDQGKFERKTVTNVYSLKPSEDHSSASDPIQAPKPDTDKNCTYHFDNLETPQSKNYYGRQALLDTIESQIVTGEKSVICLHSAAFDGKSALVFKLANKLADSNGCGFTYIFHWKFRLMGNGDGLSSTNISQFLATALSTFGESKQCEDDITRMHTLLRIMDERRVLLILENMEVFQDASGQILTVHHLIKSAIQRLCRIKSHVGSVTLMTSRLPMTELEHYDSRTANILLPKLTKEECSRIFIENNIHGTKQQLCEAAQELGCSPFAAVLMSSILNEKYGGLITRRHEIQNLEIQYSKNNELGVVTDILKYYDSLWDRDSDEYNLLLLLSLFRHPVAIERLDRVAWKIDRFKSLTKNGRIRLTAEKLKRAGLLTSLQFTVGIQIIPRSHYYQQFKEFFPQDFRNSNRIIAENILIGFDDSKVSTVSDAMPLYDAIYHYAEADELNSALDIYRIRLNRGRQFFSQKVLGAFCNDLGAVSSFFYPGSDWRPKDGLTEVDQAWLISSAAYLLNLLGAVSDSERLRRHEIEIHNRLGYTKLLVSDLLNLASNLIIQRKFDETGKALRDAEVHLSEIQKRKPGSIYEDEISFDALNNRLLIKKAQLIFWMSRENGHEILSSLSGITDIQQLPTSGRFLYFFLRLYCHQQIPISEVESLLMDKGTPYAISYAHAIYAVNDYYSGAKERALDNIEEAVKNARIANRIDQLPAILLLRLYLYRLIFPHESKVFDLTDVFEEMKNTYSLNLYTAEYNVLRLEMLIDTGNTRTANEALAEIEQYMDYSQYYYNRLQACKEVLNNLETGRKHE